MNFLYGNENISLQIHDSLNDNTVILPPRAAVFRIFKIEKFDKPSFIPNMEIEEGIFTANSIAHSESVIIRVLSTTDETKIISNRIDMGVDLDLYNIYSINGTKNSGGRKDKIRGIIGKNCPDFIKNELTELTASYSAVFAMPDDLMSQNNFCTQKLRLTDNSPTYCKNYRMPKSIRTKLINK